MCFWQMQAAHLEAAVVRSSQQLSTSKSALHSQPESAVVSAKQRRPAVVTVTDYDLVAVIVFNCGVLCQACSHIQWIHYSSKENPKPISGSKCSYVACIYHLGIMHCAWPTGSRSYTTVVSAAAAICVRHCRGPSQLDKSPMTLDM